MPRSRARRRYQTRRRWTVAEARAVLAAQEQSGLSLHAFAVGQGIGAQRLYWWRRQLAGEQVAVAARPEGARPEFIEVRPRAPEPVEVLLRSGRVLRVAASIDPGVLVRLVAALEEAEPC